MQKLSDSVEVHVHPRHPADKVYQGYKDGTIKRDEYAPFDSVEISWMIHVDHSPIEITYDLYGLHCHFDINKCRFNLSIVTEICEEFSKWIYNKPLECMTEAFLFDASSHIKDRIVNVVSKHDNEARIERNLLQ